jgi:hypothetical protein
VAGDLIPPPSPAGRPPKDPVLEERPAPAEAAPPPAPAGPLPPSPFRARFGFLLGALTGVALCAAALAVTLYATSSDSGPRLAENWSPWKPESTETLAGAADIAEHVARRYMLDNGRQMVAVQRQPLHYQGLPIGVMVRPLSGPVEILEGEGLLYLLTGFGDQFRIPGKPNESRGRLLRREALELVLYTFRYLEDVTMVAVMLPPTPRAGDQDGEDETPDLVQQAVFFRPGDLLPQLQVPLARTLAPVTPRPSTMTPVEGERVDDLVLDNLFLAQYERSPDGLPYLVLQEPSNLD